MKRKPSVKLFQRVGGRLLFLGGVHDGDLPEQVWQFDPTYMKVLLASENVSAADKLVITAAYTGPCGTRREFHVTVSGDGVAEMERCEVVSDIVPVGETAESLLERWRDEQIDDAINDLYFER